MSSSSPGRARRGGRMGYREGMVCLWCVILRGNRGFRAYRGERDKIQKPRKHWKFLAFSRQKNRWTLQDLNLRPKDYESSALTD